MPEVIAPNDSGTANWIRRNVSSSPRLLPDMSWTFANNFFAAVSGLVLFKIFSKFIPAQEYGQASLVLGFVGLLTQFIAGPVILSHFGLYFEQKNKGLGYAYTTAVFKLLALTAGLMSAIYLVIALVYHALSQPAYFSLAVPAVLLLFVQTQLNGTFSFLEADKRYRALAFAQSMSKMLQVPFLFLLVLASVSGPNSVISSQVLACVTVLLFWRIRATQPGFWQTSENFPVRSIAASAWQSFGSTLYLFSFFGWMMATSDRYIIDYFWNAKEVGIYAINYALWSIPYMSLNSWLEASVRSRLFERIELGNWHSARRILLNRILLTLVLGALVTIVIYFLGERLAILIIGKRYWHSTTLMLLIGLAHLFYTTGMSYYSIFISTKRVATMMRIAGIVALLNISLNLYLVPRMGIIGAAWSTLAVYVLLFILMMGFGSRLVFRLMRAESDQQIR